MSGFTYKEAYMEEGKRVLEVNVLPEKYCNFDCIFCPIGRSENKTDAQVPFGDLQGSMLELGKRIDDTQAELVFINSMGEAFVNEGLGDIIACITTKGLPVRLLSNGYLLGEPAYIDIANRCQEVIGEIKVTTEEDFQKVQRPMAGYTLEKHISNMVSFRRQYQGKFILEVTIVKGYSDDERSIDKIKDILRELSPDKVIVARMEDEPFKKKLGISDERFEDIKNVLSNTV